MAQQPTEGQSIPKDCWLHVLTHTHIMYTYTFSAIQPCSNLGFLHYSQSLANLHHPLTPSLLKSSLTPFIHPKPLSSASSVFWFTFLKPSDQFGFQPLALCVQPTLTSNFNSCHYIQWFMKLIQLLILFHSPIPLISCTDSKIFHAGHGKRREKNGIPIK